MHDRWWKPGFLLSEWEVIDKQGEEATINYVVIIRVGDISRNRWLHIKIFVRICMYVCIQTHTFFLALSAERI